MAILAIADQVAKSVAENRIAQQIQSSGLNTKPSVNIEGWPFLTQVAAHDIKAIDISANNVTTTGGKLPVDFTARATGVHPNSSFNGATVDQGALIEKGLVPDNKQPVKILGNGEITKKLTVVAGWYSKSAFDKITKAGGTLQNAKGEPFAFPKPKKKFEKREKAKKATEAPAAEGAAPAAAPAEGA